MSFSVKDGLDEADALVAAGARVRAAEMLRAVETLSEVAGDVVVAGEANRRLTALRMREAAKTEDADDHPFPFAWADGANQMGAPEAGKADDEQAIEDVMAAVKRDDPTGVAPMRIVKLVIDEMRDTHTNALDLLLAQEQMKAKKLAAQRDMMQQRAEDAEADANRLRNERDEALGTLRELADTVGTAHNLALQKVPPARTDDEPPFQEERHEEPLTLQTAGG